MILGITGPVGCGKSFLLAAFAGRGWRIADADRICHELYADPAGSLGARLAERWGREVLDPAGLPDRRKIGAIVFENPAELSFLTGILHPLVAVEIEAFAVSCRAEGVHAAVEVPLLFEAGCQGRFDRVMAIWADPEVRRKRLAEKRGWGPEETARREACQLPADEKLERADVALINNGTAAELERQLDCWLNGQS